MTARVCPSRLVSCPVPCGCLRNWPRDEGQDPAPLHLTLCASHRYRDPLPTFRRNPWEWPGAARVALGGHHPRADLLAAALAARLVAGTSLGRERQRGLPGPGLALRAHGCRRCDSRGVPTGGARAGPRPRHRSPLSRPARAAEPRPRRPVSANARTPLCVPDCPAPSRGETAPPTQSPGPPPRVPSAPPAADPAPEGRSLPVCPPVPTATTSSLQCPARRAFPKCTSAPGQVPGSDSPLSLRPSPPSQGAGVALLCTCVVQARDLRPRLPEVAVAGSGGEVAGAGTTSGSAPSGTAF